MHRVDDVLLLSPTDLVGFLACEHLTQRELAAARGEAVRPERSDPELDLLASRGREHEAAQLQRLAAELGPPREISDTDEGLAGLRAAEAETLAAMRAGAGVIYQGAFFDGRWRGRADFLLRVERPSDLGSWSYEVADAKLARSVRVGALIQMCEYSRQLERLQGRAPLRLHVVLGTGVRESYRAADLNAYFRRARGRFELVVDGPPRPTYPDPVAHCERCAWSPECEARRRADDHLSLVAGMRGDHRRRLVEAGIETVTRLAAAPPEPRPRIGEAPWERLRRQAALQIEQRESGRPVHELIEQSGAGLGLAALPPPSAGDLFFDMEGDPLVEEGGLEYLFGVTELRGGRPEYRPIWAHDRAGERAAFEALVDLFIRRLERDPSLHVYHYAPYEPAALKRLMGRHATREDEVDRLLRGGTLVDLHQVVRQGVRVSCESYSLKSLEVFHMPGARTGAIAEGAASIVAYERWRNSGDQAELDDLAAYNRIDCESTWRLREWLEGLRDEWARSHGAPLPRPLAREGEPGQKLQEASAETRQLVERLTAGIPEESADRSPEQAARWLLAQLLDWHRREDKAAWWEHYERRSMTDEELMEDRCALGGLSHGGEVRTEKRSRVHRYSYDGTQEHRIELGTRPLDPRTGEGCGLVVALDDEAGEIELRRGDTPQEHQHPRSLVPQGPIPTDELRGSLSSLASWVIEHGVDAPGALRAGRDLLLRRFPRVPGREQGAALPDGDGDPVRAAVGIAASLDGSCLAVQGPPGAGKTRTGAEIILDQVGRGRRVGVCATTHRAIGELLRAADELARSRGTELRLLQKSGEGAACSAPMVRHTTSNQEVLRALGAGEVDVVAATQWLFCRSDVQGLLDLLIIDEAGQMSLANALAASRAATNLVLLGDPQQLAQPSRGIHPPGAEASALEHVLGGAETIPPERGVFLSQTRRMHPRVCAFVSDAFYEGRLHSHGGCEPQHLEGSGPLAGAGLRWAAVAHSGSRTWSPEEVEVTQRLVGVLLGMTWCDAAGRSRPLSCEDIVVVAPYNLQVRRLREGLPAGVRVGTVDRFQGAEAPVSIYSMATSSAEEVPRNLEFLFSRNRLNVAVSRARALAVIVCSPQLLQAGCRTPEQLRLVSALCRFVEMAAPAELDGSAPDQLRAGAGLTRQPLA